MNKFKHFETESGKTIMTAQFDGYNIAERKLEGLMFQITIQSDGSLKASVNPKDEDFFSDFNTTKWLGEAEKYAYENDTFEDPITGEECWLVPVFNNSTTTTQSIPQVTQKTPLSVVLGTPASTNSCGPNCTHDHSKDQANQILDKLFPEDSKEEVTEEEKKEIIIGKFKPKRKFLNFVQGRKGGIRYHNNIALIKAEQLSGMLEDVIFKVTICDEGTINFEETDTNKCDDVMIQRLIDDIDERDVTGYMKKYVVYGLEFLDEDGKKMYLEVDEKKPIDKLFALFDELKEPETTDTDMIEKEEIQVSDNALSLLDSLFGEEPVVEQEETKVEPTKVEEAPKETYAQQMMREAFEQMNAEKLTELTDRIEKKEKDIQQSKLAIKQQESNLKTATDDIRVLYTRLDSLKPAEAPNGYVFYVSPENKSGVVLDQPLKDVVKQISPLLKLNEDKVIEYLTKGFFTIKIAKKGDISNDNITVEKEIYEKINKMDVTGKVTIVGSAEFEYRGELTWHKLVDKMIRMGFEQEPEFDKACGSPSYQSEEVTPDGFALTLGSDMTLTPSSLPPAQNNPNPFSYKDEEEENEEKHQEKFIQKEFTKFDEPTTIVICDGSGYVNGVQTSDIMIDDDETSFDLYIGGKPSKPKSTYCSMGFANVMSLDEYKKFYESNKEMFEEHAGPVEGFVIPNFTGTIGVSSEINGKFSTDFEFNDYIYHQTSGTVVINLPEGTQIYDLNEDMSLPVAIIRDFKIEQIIK